mgnify:CR=1 FL=1
MRSTVPLLFLLNAGCTVTDAPSNLEDLLVYGFSHFEDNNAHLLDMFDELDPLVRKQGEGLADGYRINNLAPEDLEDAGVKNPDLDKILGAVASGDYTHKMDALMPPITHKNKDRIFENFIAFDVLEDTDRSCFLSGECEFYESTAEQTVKVPLLGEATQTTRSQYRWVDQDVPLMVARHITADPVEFNSSIAKITQQYGLSVMYPSGKGTRRVEALWVEAKIIGIDVPDSFAVDNFASSHLAQIERTDEYLDGL